MTLSPFDVEDRVVSYQRVANVVPHDDDQAIVGVPPPAEDPLGMYTTNRTATPEQDATSIRISQY